LREAGRTFAVPTYWFIGMLTLMIVVGLAREIFGNLPQYDPEQLQNVGGVTVGHGNGLVMGATILVILRAFANGGSSLTGVEAISNTVNLFRKPEGPNARRVLTMMATVLGLLLAGVAWLGYATRSVPYSAGYPSMLSEIGRAVFGHGMVGNVLFFLLQAASAAILYNGANTSFNGFPALTHFVAEDSFLPRPLMKRGHRLVFSNAIILLTVLAVALLVATGGSVNALVPMFAMGVFTAFSMAGYGMTKHWLTHRGPGWQYKLLINLSAGILSTSVVAIFAIAKFGEGAWLVVVVFPILVLVLMRLNHQYRAEASVLEMSLTELPDLTKHDRHRVFVFVDSVDLAEIEAMRYAQGLHADELVAVHFVLDAAHAVRLEERWKRDHPDTKVTVLLPRRTYSALLGRLLHDRTADKIAAVVSRIPGASAQIVAYDIASRIAQAQAARAADSADPDRAPECIETAPVTAPVS
jgi:amino acid transporter